MIHFSVKNRGLLLLGTVAFLGALSLFWPTEQDSDFRESADGEFRQVQVESEQSATQLTSREVEPSGTERQQSQTVESPGTRLGPPPGYRTGWSDFLRQAPEPVLLAESSYKRKWEEFINNMGLENEPVVRAIITEWEQFNAEIYYAMTNGDITPFEMLNNFLSIEDLQERLAPYLTSEQLVDIDVIDEAYEDYMREKRNIEDARRDAQGYNHRLLTASNSANIDSVQALVSSGADVNFVTTDGDRTPLSNAIRQSRPEIAELLIDAGANVNWADSAGYTHLMDAARDGNLDMVRLLISHNADLEITVSPDFPDTVLWIATSSNEPEIVSELLRAGADASGEAGESALRLARLKGNIEIVRMLEDAGAR